MYEKEIICFAASYFTLKTLGYMVGMPLSSNYKKDLDNLSPTSQDHYKDVKNDRRIKGYISIFLGLVLGYLIYHQSTELKMKERISLSLFVGFFSMSIFYESMWQNKFIFEEKNISKLLDDGCSASDVKDIQIYSHVYKNHRFVGNIIEVVSIGISLIIALVFHYLQ